MWQLSQAISPLWKAYQLSLSVLALVQGPGFICLDSQEINICFREATKEASGIISPYCHNFSLSPWRFQIWEYMWLESSVHMLLGEQVI